MAKRQPFDTNLSFPPAPTRALLSTPLDGIIGGPAPRQEPPPIEEVHENAAPPVHMSIETEPEARSDQPVLPPAARVEPVPTVESAIARVAQEPASAPRRESVDTSGRTGPADDGKVTVKLPPELKNRLYNAIYAERATVGDYLTLAVQDLIDQLERDRGGPYPQRPPADDKFRAGRRPR